MIDYAILVGSDYYIGLEKIGKVTATQILAFFSKWAVKGQTNQHDILETFKQFMKKEEIKLIHPRHTFYSSIVLF